MATKTLFGRGATLEEAREQLERQVPPPGARLVREAVAQEPRAAQAGTLELEAWDLNEARSGAGERTPEGADYSLKSDSCVRAPRKGLLGLGRRRGLYRVEWTTAPREAVVRRDYVVTYREDPPFDGDLYFFVKCLGDAYHGADQHKIGDDYVQFIMTPAELATFAERHAPDFDWYQHAGTHSYGHAQYFCFYPRGGGGGHIQTLGLSTLSAPEPWLRYHNMTSSEDLGLQRCPRGDWVQARFYGKHQGGGTPGSYETAIEPGDVRRRCLDRIEGLGWTGPEATRVFERG